MKYVIHVCVTTFERYEVEADSEEEAREKFWNEDLKPEHSDSDSEVTGVELVEENGDE